jgi:hypothetical protein
MKVLDKAKLFIKQSKNKKTKDSREHLATKKKCLILTNRNYEFEGNWVD